MSVRCKVIISDSAMRAKKEDQQLPTACISDDVYLTSRPHYYYESGDGSIDLSHYEYYEFMKTLT
jgi:hypothetical protein